MKEHAKSLICIHVAVFLFGFSALFARLINQSALVITAGRCVLSGAFIMLIVFAARKNLRLNSRLDGLKAIAAGLFFGGHLFGYFQAIQLSTVAIGVITFATLPIFTAVLEPVFFRERPKRQTVYCAVLMFLGILITVPWGALEKSSGVVPGLLVGLAGTLAYALMSILNRSLSKQYEPMVLVFYEHVTLGLLFIPVLWLTKPVFSPADLAWLLVAGLVVAVGGHYLFIRGLKQVKISTAGVIGGLETVYAIVLASLVLREIPTINEIIGGLVVFAVAIYLTTRSG